MQRRTFIEGIAALAAAWPVAARAQRSAMPVIGFLSTATSTELPPALVDDLVHRQVAVIAALGTPATMAAKAATKTIPIVFGTAGDPVKLDLVASLNRPGGNVTGVTILTLAVTPKRWELLHEVIPMAHVMALLVNPANPALAEENSSSVRSAADALGLELHVLNASTEHDFDEVFAKLIKMRAGGPGNRCRSVFLRAAGATWRVSRPPRRTRALRNPRIRCSWRPDGLWRLY